MSTPTEPLPAGAAAIADDFPEMWTAYAALGKACAEAGPIAARTTRLVKLALAIGAHSKRAVHSDTRRALAEGIRREELRQAASLAIPTLGFPRAVKALTWIEDVGYHRGRTVECVECRLEVGDGNLALRRRFTQRDVGLAAEIDGVATEHCRGTGKFRGDLARAVLQR
jgi:alkylhydroperoxidase/carboxymuconolactone decarboxylase family protein YurZ